MKSVRADIEKLCSIAGAHRMRPTIRLNSTSDILYERLAPELFAAFPGVQFYDYTKIPIEQRDLPPNYHLTYSVGGPEDMGRAIAYLRAGQSVAVVVPVEVRDMLAGIELDIGPCTAGFIDGDENDLRFLDAPGSIVLLKPKGHKRSDLIRPDILQELRTTAKAFPAISRRAAA